MTGTPLTDPDCPHSVPQEWNRSDSEYGNVLLYTLRQNGWRKGQPVMVNDVTVRIEASHGSNTDIKPIADAIQRALSVRDQINGGVMQEAREIAAKAAAEFGFGASAAMIIRGDLDKSREVRAAVMALTTAQAEREQLEARVKDLDWFSGQHSLSINHYSPFYCDDIEQSVEWRVIKEGGSINDREFDVVGRGETVCEAIAAARAVLQEQRP